MTRSLKHLFRPLLPLVVYMVIFSALFVIIEGPASSKLLLSSLFYSDKKEKNTPQFAEKVHTEYDKDIGWINLPDLFIKDLYGPGKFFKTNSQRFRNDHVFPSSVPDRYLRLICSGDSFTLGYGVDNDHTWPQTLTRINKVFETVNMAQGGYGVDQAYLWYLRDGIKLDHDIHILAFISSDFDRMLRKNSFGYNKPYLKLENGRIQVHNVPVPKKSSRAQWITRNINILRDLKTVKAFGRFYKKHFLDKRDLRDSTRSTRTPLSDEPLTRAELPALSLKIFEDLDRINKEKGSVFVAVYLPTLGDSKPTENTDTWRAFLSENLKRKNIHFIDLVPEWRKLPGHGDLVITGRGLPYAGAYGHYSENGNLLISSWIYRKLLAFPDIVEKVKNTIR